MFNDANIRDDAMTCHTPVLALLCLAMLVGAPARAAAQEPDLGQAPAARELYQRACAACHGTDGRGMPQSTVGFDVALPDFTDCSFATPEPEADWMAVIHDGGPVRAFDRRMPAFGEALSAEELLLVHDYAQTFCTDRAAWPRGELNFPRALVTEKAFPENEAVVTTVVNATGDGRVSNEFLYERRLGSRSQFEVLVPVVAAEASGGSWQQGLGDVAFALKRVLFHSLDAGRIVSVSGEVILPTGKESLGLGTGATIVEPFVTFGQALPSDGFVQIQAGGEFPSRGDNEAFWRVALGKTVSQGPNGFGRAWTPMVEVLAARDLMSNATTHWDLLPEMQVTLNRRQHIMINVGVRIPLNDREGRSPQVVIYFLWDWFDGGLFEGWE